MLEISEIIKKAKAGDGDAIAELIYQNQGMIHKIAFQFQSIYHGANEMDDLIQDGSIGLLHAIKKYNPKFAVKFSTYAYYWIRHAIWRSGLKEHDLFRLGVRESSDLMTYRNTERLMKDKLKRKPLPKEISEMSNMSLKRVKRAQEYAQVSKVSYDEICEMQGIYYEQRQILEERENLSAILNELKDPAKTVIQLRYGLNGYKNHTIREVGQKLGLSICQVNKIEKRSINRLRSQILIY